MFIDDVFKWLEELFGAIKKIRIGSGGFFKYEEIISRNMIAQEESMSCAAACIRQYAKDNKIEITEKLIRELAGTDTVLGTTDIGIIKGLEDVFKNKEILSNTYFRNS